MKAYHDKKKMKPYLGGEIDRLATIIQLDEP